MARISVKGLSNHFKYEDMGFETDEAGGVGGVLTITWDYKNDKVDKLMDKEHRPKLGDKLNMLWVKKLKEVSGWVQGESIYAILKSNADGYFNVWFDKVKEHNCYDLIIEPSGYVSRRYFNHYTLDENKDDNIRFSITIRTECVYNDWWCDQLNKKK